MSRETKKCGYCGRVGINGFVEMGAPAAINTWRCKNMRACQNRYVTKLVHDKRDQMYRERVAANVQQRKHVDLRMLRSIDKGNITWKQHGTRGASYREWMNAQNDYRIVTSDVKRLVLYGYAATWSHPNANRGGVELTAKGLVRLQELTRELQPLGAAAK